MIQALVAEDCSNMTIFFVKMLKSSFGCGLTTRPFAQGEAGLRPTTIDRRDYRSGSFFMKRKQEMNPTDPFDGWQATVAC